MRPIVLKKPPPRWLSVGSGAERAGAARRSSGDWRLHWDDLDKRAENPGGGGEEELVFCLGWPASSQAIELQDAFEVGEQHLDLLPLAAEVRYASVVAI